MTGVTWEDKLLFSDEFRLIEHLYEGRKTERSQVPLINHIVEGCMVLQERGAPLISQRAFCLHPVFQNDEDLFRNYGRYTFDQEVLVLAMEYRNIANQYLSNRKINSIDEIALSPLLHVNEMLVADKVQNYKDFLLFHKGTHARSDELDEYFQNWFKRLEISQEQFEEYFCILTTFRLGVG